MEGICNYCPHINVCKYHAETAEWIPIKMVMPENITMSITCKYKFLFPFHPVHQTFIQRVKSLW